MAENEIVVDNTEDLKFSFFDVPDGGLSVPEVDDEVIEEEVEKETIEKVEEIKEPEPVDEEVVDEEEEELPIEDPIDEEEPSEVSDVDRTLSELVESGRLLLPEDYEYEDSKEGIAKAFEDSEKFRNQLAFQEAIKFLTSKDGLDMMKIREVNEGIFDIDNVDIDSLEEDDKLKVIKYFYKEIKEYDDDDAEEMLEGLIESDKVDKELEIASKHIKRHKQKIIEAEAKNAQLRRESEKQALENSQKLLKQKLEQDDFGGYQIPKTNKEKVFEMIYKPVKTKDGNITTEFNSKLENVLSSPDKILVLADLLLNMDDKGFKFDNLKREIENGAIEKTKKKLKTLRQSGGKVKVSGGLSKSQSEFDLSKASLFS